MTQQKFVFLCHAIKWAAMILWAFRAIAILGICRAFYVTNKDLKFGLLFLTLSLIFSWLLNAERAKFLSGETGYFRGSKFGKNETFLTSMCGLLLGYFVEIVMLYGAITIGFS